MADPVTNLVGIPITDLTESKLNGSGTLDVIMRTVTVHLQSQYDENRIRGPEYAKVYVESIEAAMRIALDFLLQRNEAALKAQLMQLQIELAGVEKEKAQVEVEKARVELTILQQQATKIPFEIDLLKAQTSLVSQQALNAVIEGNVLSAQLCKLKAEYDLTMQQVLKSIAETTLLDQKTKTEIAQTNGAGVDANSVIGRQMALYKAQADGFLRDAEQKAAKIFSDTWSVRRTTDEGTVADATNKLDDVTIGKAMQKLLAGVGIVV